MDGINLYLQKTMTADHFIVKQDGRYGPSDSKEKGSLSMDYKDVKSDMLSPRKVTFEDLK